MDRFATVKHDNLKQYIVNVNQIDSDCNVKWQIDLENTKITPFTILHKINENLPHWAEVEFCGTVH